jgi:hypothetical protein
MRLSKEHTQFIVDWVMGHSEINGFQIILALDQPRYHFGVNLDFGYFRYGFTMAFECLMGECRPEMVIREALEVTFAEARHALRNQSTFKDSPI